MDTQGKGPNFASQRPSLGPAAQLVVPISDTISEKFVSVSQAQSDSFMPDSVTSLSDFDGPNFLAESKHNRNNGEQFREGQRHGNIRMRQTLPR